jgi:hopanoid biosynthesis associated protein HpnK
MKRLIVSADDFGLTRSINQGIAQAYKDGIVTCIHVMPSGGAFGHALELSREMGLEEVGAHLALTETSPVGEPVRVPTLVSAPGRFPGGRIAFLMRYLFGSVDKGQAYSELKDQMDALAATGLRIMTLSCHEHLHMIPAILDLFILIAREYGVPAIRFPHGERPFRPGMNAVLKSLALSLFERPMRKALRNSAIVSPDHFRGLMDSGSLDEEVILRIIEALEDGTTELVCHPGILGPEIPDKYPFHRNCETELSALTGDRVKKLIEDRGIALVRYSDFLAGA